MRTRGRASRRLAMTISRSDAAQENRTAPAPSGFARAYVRDEMARVPAGKRLAAFAVVNKYGTITDYYACNGTEDSALQAFQLAWRRSEVSAQWSPKSGPHAVEPVTLDAIGGR